MKKLACFLAVALMLLPVTALCQSDLSSMSTGDLIELKNQIMAELFGRGELKEVSVPSGEYIVGEHIPAGEYSVAIADDGIIAAVIVNEYEDVYSLSKDGGIGRLVLKDGDVVSVTGNVLFTKFAGLAF